MSKFRKGQYVVFNDREVLKVFGFSCIVKNNIYKIEDIKERDGITFIMIEGNKGSAVFEKDIRQATNNDYLNILTLEQKVKFFYDIANGKTKINWREYPNQVHFDWLNSPYDGWEVK